MKRQSNRERVMLKYWLMKSEPSVYSIDDLQKDGFSIWEGVRNYQARNFMRDQMKVGDLVLFYHSNANPSGIAGICRICRESFPDPTAKDPSSHYYDPKATEGNPIWMTVEVEFVEKFTRFITLGELRQHHELLQMPVLKKGSRLSIQPIEKRHFDIVCQLGKEHFSTVH